MKRILLASAAFVALTSASYAADLAVEPVMEVDAWSGYFVGIQGGYAWGDLTLDNLTELAGYSSDIEGGFGGAYWGKNWQSGNWVYGLEGSISFANIEDQNDFATDDIDADVTIEAFSTSRLKLGYAFSDNFLVYAAGGLSIARANVDDGFEDNDAYLKGFTVGAGLEAKFAENWSARVEYLYINYETEQRTIFPGDTYDVSVEDVNLVRGGIAYHF